MTTQKALDKHPIACAVVTVLNDSMYGKQRRQLLIHNRSDHPYGGGWCWPGGKVEMGELVEHAAARELKEETGLVLPWLRLFMLVQHGNCVVFHYYGFTKESYVELEKGKHNAFTWMTSEQLLETCEERPQDVFPPLRMLLTAVSENKLTSEWDPRLMTPHCIQCGQLIPCGCLRG